MKHKADVVIIGGGVNGCSLAYQLAKKDMKVVLCERNYLCSGATGRCGAGIRQQWSTRENAELAIKSVKIFKKLEKELGQEIGLRQGGYLIVVHNEKDMKQAEKNVKMQKNLGLDVSILTQDEIGDVVPILDVKGMNAIGATFCPTDGHVDPFKTTQAYAQAALNYGAKLYKFTKIVDIKTKKKKIQSVLTNKGTIVTDTVINAAGAWSKQIAEMVNVKLPNKPFRKEILVTERVKPVFKAMVISFKDGIYFSQQEEGQILGGIPIPGEKAGYLASPTFVFLHHMAKTLTRYAPSLKHVNVIRQWTGYYDVTPDARPILGEVERVERFIQCNGFSGHGFMLSPMVTKILTEYITDGRTPHILERLNLDRFKNAKIKREVSVVG
ncbi:MAG: FAD-binding oxidoreductase [Thermoplasmatales archaeon]|nr:MAG: FAD-binding oxidoreductase [Thermoplasmatales archaeon]